MRSLYGLLACAGIQKKGELIYDAYVQFFQSSNGTYLDNAFGKNNMLP